MSLQSSTTLVLGLAFHLEVSVTIALFGSRGGGRAVGDVFREATTDPSYLSSSSVVTEIKPKTNVS